jgi:hypothetical protein
MPIANIPMPWWVVVDSQHVAQHIGDFSTREDAIKRAENLASQTPEKRYYVCQCIAHVEAVQTKTVFYHGARNP